MHFHELTQHDGGVGAAGQVECNADIRSVLVHARIDLRMAENFAKRSATPLDALLCIHQIVDLQAGALKGRQLSDIHFARRSHHVFAPQRT
jgi:hypothetical protein